MKKRHLFFLFVFLLFQSCLKDDEVIFKKSASERMKERIEHDLSVLIGARNGWLMQYYPSRAQLHGGFNLLVKFEENDKVTVSSELSEATKEVVSLFKIIPETGPLLSFDSYNELIHYFSNPLNPNGIGAPNVGMEGDYEFIIIEATPEQVIMKGKKTGNRILMKPIAEGAVWSNILKDLTKDSKLLNRFRNGSFLFNGVELATIRKSAKTLTFSFLDDNSSFSARTIRTEKGFDIYQAFTPLDPQKIDRLSQMSVSSFAWSFDELTYTALDQGVDAKIIMQEVPKLNLSDVLGDWTISYIDELSDDKERVSKEVNFAMKVNAESGAQSLYMTWKDGFLEDFLFEYDEESWELLLYPAISKKDEITGEYGRLLIYGEPFFSIASHNGISFYIRNKVPMILESEPVGMQWNPESEGFAYVKYTIDENGEEVVSDPLIFASKINFQKKQ